MPVPLYQPVLNITTRLNNHIFLPLPFSLAAVFATTGGNSQGRWLSRSLEPLHVAFPS